MEVFLDSFAEQRGKVGGVFAGAGDFKLFVILVEFLQVDETFRLFLIFSFTDCPEVDVQVVLEKKNGLLLADGHLGGPLDRLQVVELDSTRRIRLLDGYLWNSGSKVVLGHLGVVFVFPVPRVLVPDGACAGGRVFDHGSF